MKKNMVGCRFGRLEVIALSDKRGSRGNRTVPLWECRCDCGKITYKATDILKNDEISMCNDCRGKYATERMREKAGYVGGTQISRIKNDTPGVSNTSGVRGVYFDKKSNKWRARLRFQGKIYNLGSYSGFEDAVKARKQAEDDIYGKFLEQI